MCGFLLTSCIGRNNNGPIDPTGPVGGENVNTKVVKLLPIEKKKEDNMDQEQRQGYAEAKITSERAVMPEHEVNAQDDSRDGKKARVKDANELDNIPAAQRQSRTRAILSDFTNAIVARNV